MVGDARLAVRSGVGHDDAARHLGTRARRRRDGDEHDGRLGVRRRASGPLGVGDTTAVDEASGLSGVDRRATTNRNQRVGLDVGEHGGAGFDVVRRRLAGLLDPRGDRAGTGVECSDDSVVLADGAVDDYDGALDTLILENLGQAANLAITEANTDGQKVAESGEWLKHGGGLLVRGRREATGSGHCVVVKIPTYGDCEGLANGREAACGFHHTSFLSLVIAEMGSENSFYVDSFRSSTV